MLSYVVANYNYDSINKGLTWLEKKVEDDLEEDNLKRQLSQIGKDRYVFDREIIEELIDIKLIIKYHSSDILPFFVLSFSNSALARDFKKYTEQDEFWKHLESEIMFCATNGRSHNTYFFHEMGLSSNRHFIEIFNECKKDQTIEGKYYNEDDHVSFLRLAIALDPFSATTKNALKYSLEQEHHLIRPFESSIFILALMELDYSGYIETINEGIKFLENNQNDDGSWGKYENHKIRDTLFAIKAICRMEGNNSDYVKRGIKFIIEKQHESGASDISNASHQALGRYIMKRIAAKQFSLLGPININ